MIDGNKNITNSGNLTLCHFSQGWRGVLIFSGIRGSLCIYLHSPVANTPAKGGFLTYTSSISCCKVYV